MDDLVVRPAESGDIPAILELERSTQAAAHWSAEHYRAMVESTSAVAGRLVLVVYSSGASGIIGFVVARDLSPEWELENIAVEGSKRRKGVGRQLIGELLTRARRAAGEAIFLEVRDSNLAARALYQGTGFQESGRRARYYSDPPEDAILYRLNLT